MFAFSLNVKQYYLNLSGATTPGQGRPGSDGSEEVLHIPQSSSFTGASPSDCLVLYLGHSLGGGSLTPLQRYSRCILQPQLSGLQENHENLNQNSFNLDSKQPISFKKLFQKNK